MCRVEWDPTQPTHFVISNWALFEGKNYIKPFVGKTIVNHLIEKRSSRFKASLFVTCQRRTVVSSGPVQLNLAKKL